MTALVLPTGPSEGDGDIFTRIIKSIEKQGYIVLDNAFPEEVLSRLFVYLKDINKDEFHPAGVGRANGFQINEFTRRDRICWLEKGPDETQSYFEWIETLRQRINRDLFLGLFDYECHFAHYPKGAFYKKHVDAFKGQSNRRLSTILYLNPQWNVKDGGELAMYQPSVAEPFINVEPVWGRVVIFLSEVFPHEVLPASRSRYSLTGWYRVNATIGENLDPPK
ncbi:2OG-Fe(II) oxygenase [Aurantivibrio plasticivorans]